jgi:hypothetical protein
MQRGRYTKLAIRVAVAFVSLLVSIFAIFILEQRRTQEELGAVLSAYVSDQVLNNSRDWDSGRGIQIILQREAQRPGMLRGRWGLLFERGPQFPQASLVTRISFALSNAVSTDIRAELHLPGSVEFFIVSHTEQEQSESSSFQRRFPRSLGFIAVSQAGLNFGKTEAILYIDHFCPLCGGGGYVLMRKVSGVWRVVDQHGTWVS